MLDSDDPRAPPEIWVQFSTADGDVAFEDIHMEDPPQYHAIRYIRASIEDNTE
jgi:hypothetical protein